MKKFLSFLIFLLLPLGFLINNSTYNFYNVFYANNVSSYCYIYNKNDVNINLVNKQATKYVKNGTKMFVTFKNKTFLQNAKEPSYKQVTITYNAKNLLKSLNKIKAKFVKSENYENKKILFYYTPVWHDYKILGQNKVNIQIVINNSIVTIGYPMVYGSF